MKFNPEDAARATEEDQILLRAVHNLGSRFLLSVGKKYRIKKVPFVGWVVSDPKMIREIYLDRAGYTKNGEGASSSFWTPIVGENALINMHGDDHMKYRRALAPVYRRETFETILAGEFATVNEKLSSASESNPVDIVDVVRTLSFVVNWKVIGLPLEVLDRIDVAGAGNALRRVTHGINPAKKKFTEQQVATAQANLTFLEMPVEAAYKAPTPGTVISALKDAQIAVEDVTSVVKTLMITGTETLNSFLPRMTALFIKTDILSQLTDDNIMTVIDEAFRVTVPTPVAVRSALADTELDGQSIRAGERLILNTFSAAAREGDFNPASEGVNKDLRDLWFGAGAHQCIGHLLAKETARMFAETLVQVDAAARAEGSRLLIDMQESDDKGHTGAFAVLTVIR